MMRRLAPLGGVLLLACALLASGCGRGGSRRAAAARPDHPLPAEPMLFDGPPGEYGGRIVVSTLGPPKTFNVMLSNEATTSDIISGLVFEGLLDFDNVKQEIIPGLASRWEQSPDGRVWTFHLRDGARWSDGAPLTADDVLFTAQVLADSVVHPSAADLLRVQGQLPRFEKVDDATVRITLPTAYGPFLHALSGARIIPRHKLEPAWRAGRFNETWGIDTPVDSIVGNGAFVLARHVPNEQVVLKPNPWYYKVDSKRHRLPYIDELVYVVVPDQNAEVIKFRSGETDALYLRAEDYQSIKAGEAAGGYTVLDLGPEPGTNFFWFNQNRGRSEAGKPYVDPVKLAWFTDRRFREAVAHAIDRDTIIRNVFYGLAEPLYGPIPPSNKVWFYQGITRYPYDLDRARALLESAGYVDRNGDGIREDPQGNRLSFRMSTNAGNKERSGTATIIVEDLKKIGLDAQFQPIEFNALVTAIQRNYDYEALLLGTTGGNPPDPVMMMNSLKSSGRTHYWWPQQKTPATPWEAEVDSLADRQLMLTDTAERKALVDRIQELYARELPAIYTVGRKGMIAIRTRIKNARPSIFRPYAVWNAEELWIDPGAADPAGR